VAAIDYDCEGFYGHPVREREGQPSSGILKASWSAMFTSWFIQEHPHRGQA